MPAPELPRATIPFHRHHRSGRELAYVTQAIEGSLTGDGVFTRRCHALLEKQLRARKVMLTPSCTAALEMAAVLFANRDREPGEVIVPGFTFVTSANAFVVHGYDPVFVDVRPEDCNIDPDAVRRAITPRTRAIAPVHYGGVPADMDAIMHIAQEHGLAVVEDAAQALFSRRGDKHAGTVGHLGCFSFHGTKNLGCGEGGALLVNDERYLERAEIVWEKGTDRSKFLRGEIDKYTWVDEGASYLPSELQAAFLLAQLEDAHNVHGPRESAYHRYVAGLKGLRDQGRIELPVLPDGVESNYHLFHIILDSIETRDALIAHLKERGIGSAFHYVPLHLSPFGSQWGKGPGSLPVVERVSETLLRLPLYSDLSTDEVERVLESVHEFFRRR